MSLFNLGDMLSYQDMNDIKRLWASDTAPSNPGNGEVWLDTSVVPNQLKRYTGSGWDSIGEMTAADILSLLQTVDGAGSGLDADRLDGQDGSYYRDATNLDAGTLSQDRLPSGVIHTDQAADISAHMEWQDGYQARFGNGADLRIHSDGANAYIDSYNGDLYLRQIKHGGKTYLQAEDASGVIRGLLKLDPDAPKVQSEGAIISQMYMQTLANNDIFDTGIDRRSVGTFMIYNTAGGAQNGAQFTVGGNMNTTANYGVSRIDGYSLSYGVTKDMDGKINVYCEASGNLKVQNKSGSSKTIYMGFFGVNVN